MTTPIPFTGKTKRSPKDKAAEESSTASTEEKTAKPEPEFDFGDGARGDILRQLRDMVLAGVRGDVAGMTQKIKKAVLRVLRSGLLSTTADHEQIRVVTSTLIDWAELPQDATAAAHDMLKKTLKAVPPKDDDEETHDYRNSEGERPDGLPHEFFATAQGIFAQRMSPLGVPLPPTFVCSPLVIRALSRDGGNQGWGLMVEVTDGDGRTHFATIKADILAGDSSALRGELLRLGAILGPGKQASAHLRELFALWRPSARARAHERLGWTSTEFNAFVLGDGQTLGEGVHTSAASAPHSVAQAMTEQGSLDDWKSLVAEPAGRNGVLVLSICLALTGPLLEPSGLDGFGLHLRGPSSRGKTTALRVAASVWGSPRYLQTWRATSNGLEGAATAANSAAMVLDELGQIDGREAGAVAYMLSNGSGKARASRDGSARSPATWRTVFLSSGELSLAAKMAEARVVAKAGQMVRCIDIPATTRAFGAFDEVGKLTPAAFADSMNSATAKAYGTAGRTFVRYLIEAGPDKIRKEIERHALDLKAMVAANVVTDGEDGQVTRVTDRLALVAAAGELATAAGVTGWKTGTAAQATLSAFIDWREAFGAGSAETAAIVTAVRDHLLLHSSRFQALVISDAADMQRAGGKPGPDQDDLVLNIADGDLPHGEVHGWVGGGFYFINAAAWKLIVAPLGLDPTDAARYLRAAGHLVKGDGRNLTYRMPRGIAARPRVYRVKVDILGGDEGQADA